MQLTAAAFDYDGTLATEGRVSPQAVQALHQLKDAGLAVVIVTGRIFADLKDVFAALTVADFVVAENGAVLCEPKLERETLLTQPVSPLFVEALRGENVQPLSVGLCIVATTRGYAHVVQDAANRLALPVQLALNKQSLMVLPPGIDKGSGLTAALQRLGLPSSAVAAFGDAENDVPLFRACGVGVAVKNAVPELQQLADYVCEQEDGKGICDWIQRMLKAI